MLQSTMTWTVLPPLPSAMSTWTQVPRGTEFFEFAKICQSKGSYKANPFSVCHSITISAKPYWGFIVSLIFCDTVQCFYESNDPILERSWPKTKTHLVVSNGSFLILHSFKYFSILNETNFFGTAPLLSKTNSLHERVLSPVFFHIFSLENAFLGYKIFLSGTFSALCFFKEKLHILSYFGLAKSFQVLKHPFAFLGFAKFEFVLYQIALNSIDV